MIADSKEKTAAFLPNAADYIGKIEKNSPAWLGAARRREWERFVRLGIPSVKHEEWKYTGLNPMLEHAYALAEYKARETTGALDGYWDADDINIVFINGALAAGLSSLDKAGKGVTILPLAESWQKMESAVRPVLERESAALDTSFASLNRALNNHGVFIDIAPKAVCENVIHIIHLTDAEGQKALFNPRTVIRAGEASEATVLETHISFDQKLVYLDNALTEITCAANAVLHYCKAQAASREAFHIATTKVWQERGSQFDGFTLTTGGRITRNNLDIEISGEGAGAILNGLYAISGSQHVDNHSAVDHQQPNCTSNQLYKGILNGDARAVFNGKIFVKPIAQLTNSYQLNKNLLLGKNCRVDTKPQLEIGADDVKCTHGATIGQLNEDEIFYLQSRAIERRQAVSMLSHGFVDDIVNTVKHASIRSKLNTLIEPTFAAID